MKSFFPIARRPGVDCAFLVVGVTPPFAETPGRHSRSIDN